MHYMITMAWHLGAGIGIIISAAIQDPVLHNLIGISGPNLLGKRAGAAAQPLETVGHVRLATARVVGRKPEPPAHLDPPETTIQQTKNTQKDATQPERIPDRLIVDVDRCQVEDEEGSQAEEDEGHHVHIHVAKAQPTHVPSENAAAAEQREVSKRDVIPHIKHAAHPLRLRLRATLRGIFFDSLCSKVVPLLNGFPLELWT